MVKTRFSPSPTGLLHLGNVRAALFSALYAKSTAGTFTLRIEDTDATRSEDHFADILQDDLKWLGIHWQEGPDIGGPNAPYLQSQRHDIYDKYYRILEEKKLAYPCFCSEQELALNRKLQLSRGQPPRYPGTCRNYSAEVVQEKIAAGKKPTLRFQVPTKKSVEFTDLVKGPQNFNSDDIGDFIIRRAEGTASFMYCNAIDDSLMGITHVIRGEDHLANTPRQLMILDALELRKPSYGHLSLITGDDGTPLSKRHGSFSLHDLREQGYLPQAVLNYLARLSHSYESNHLMTFEELGEHFNLEKISRASARFDSHQLLHWQKETVMKLQKENFWQWVGSDIQNQVPAGMQDAFAHTVSANICFPDEANKWAQIFFANNLDFTDEQQTVLRAAGSQFFETLQDEVEKHGSDLKPILDAMKSKLNIQGKNLFMPLRVALTGQNNGPELLQIAGLLGKEKMKDRFQDALLLVKG